MAIEYKKFTKSLYLAMYLSEVSPYQLEDEYWNSLLGMDHKETATELEKLGYLKLVGQTSDGHPIYQCTEKGHQYIKTYSQVNATELYRSLDSQQQSLLKKTANWILEAIAKKIIGNCIDALSQELFGKVSEQVNQIAKQEVIKKVEIVEEENVLKLNA